MDEYRDVFTSAKGLDTMGGEPMHITLHEDATPFAMHAACQIPIAHKEATKVELDRMVKAGIIQEVHHPTDWVHPRVVVEKPSGGVQLCLDITKLNKHVKCPLYPTRTPRDVIASISPGNRYFVTLDTEKGYWQVPWQRHHRT